MKLGNDEDIIILAKTIYGEARGEIKKPDGGINSLIAVANVIVNRFKEANKNSIKSEKIQNKTITQICRKKKQFSCWNDKDPNLTVIQNIDKKPDDIYKKCLEIAKLAINDQLKDITNGANHYFAKYIDEPYWAKGKAPVRIIGSHKFYKL